MADELRDIPALVADGAFEEALDRLKTAAHAASPDLHQEAVIHESSYRRLQRDYRRGLITREEHDREARRLTAAILGFAEDVSRRARRTVVPVPPATVRESARVESFKPQQIIGINNLKQISWIEVGLRAARSVCRVLTPNGAGTGFLIADGLLMTNNHVLPDVDIARASQAEFDYQQDDRGGFLPSVRFEFNAAAFHTDIALDYTIVGVAEESGKPRSATWGRLVINANADPAPSEHVAIIQHPNGGYKQIALNANWVVSTHAPFVRYTTDTMPGSSGAPVFNDSWHVVAIHRAGGQREDDGEGGHQYVNEGVLMSAIRAHAGGNWPV